MANIVIHNKDDINEIYEFESSKELAIFLNRDAESVQNSLYKIQRGIRKSKTIRSFYGTNYEVDTVIYDSIFKFKKNHIIYNVSIYGEEECITFNNYKELKRFLEYYRDIVSRDDDGHIIIELEMKNVYK